MHSAALLLFLLTCCICIVAAQTSATTESEENRYEKEIKCYGLPYGVTGFISHLLTYYTAIILACGRTLLLPWRELDQGPQNIFLGIAKLILTTVASIASIATCVHTWEFAALAAMKLSLSLTYGLISIFHAKQISLLYLPGAIAGLAGSFSIAASTMSEPAMKLVTGLFWGLAGMTSATIILAGCTWGRGQYTPAAVLVCVMAYGALYSDWVLVIVANAGVSGYPHRSPTWEKVLWVFYFIGKRLALFMT
ncbi:hypothetical protein RB213_011272 [Colletotrichum asianum]